MNRYLARIFCRTRPLFLSLCIIIIIALSFIGEAPLSGQLEVLEGNRKFVEYYTAEDFKRDASHLDEKKDFWPHCIKFYKDLVTICLHPYEDVISDQLRDAGVWETELNCLLVNALKLYPRNDTVFLDVGTNIGTHSLPIAVLGNRVWSIEPTKHNQIRLEKSRRLNGLSRDRMTIVKNAVADVRTTVMMNLPYTDNFGGAQSIMGDIIKGINLTEFQSMARSVLLSDIMDAIQADHRQTSQRKLNVVIKMDIEGFECKAFLGSEGMFQPNPIFSVPLIVMEWRFNIDFKECPPCPCPQEMLLMLVEMLSSAGYIPYKILRTKDLFLELNPKEALDWGTMDLAWMLQTEATVMQTELRWTLETDIDAYGKKELISRAM